jgi:hypothetical protein
VGPNGLGVMNMEIGLALPFSQITPMPRQGNISVIAQSGGVGMHVIAWMTKEGLGLNKFLSLGNKLNVKENEALAYFLEDPGTEMIYLYLEGLEDGRELLEVAKSRGQAHFSADAQRGLRNHEHRHVPHRVFGHGRKGGGLGLPSGEHLPGAAPGRLSSTPPKWWARPRSRATAW